MNEVLIGSDDFKGSVETNGLIFVGLISAVDLSDRTAYVLEKN